MKARIVELTHPDGRITFQIQQKHWLFRWIWVGAGCNSWEYFVTDTFSTLKEAEKNFCYYDGSKTKMRVVK